VARYFAARLGAGRKPLTGGSLARFVAPAALHFKTSFSGRAWALPDSCDTDMITPGKYLTIIDPKGLAEHILEGWRQDFPKLVKAGDILVAGDNMGCGSSREHAPLSMLGAGVPVVIARSFARIFYRNAINVGLPVMECPDLPKDFVKDGETVSVDLTKGVVRNETRGLEAKGIPLSAKAIEILDAGGLVNIVRHKLAKKGHVQHKATGNSPESDFRQDDDRHLAGAHDGLRHGPQHGPFEAGAAVASHDHERGLVLGHGLRHDLLRLAFDRDGLQVDLLARLGRPLFGVLLPLGGGNLGPHLADGAAGADLGQRRERVHEHQRRAQVLSQLDRGLEGAAAGGGKVHGHDDGVHARHCVLQGYGCFAHNLQSGAAASRPLCPPSSVRCPSGSVTSTPSTT
jgi:3-isopropylmalate/(R)-2-methylmalate dehydratase small subunit